MKINGNAIRPGNIIEFKNRLWRAVKIQHVKPGKGGAFMQVELKDIRDGTKLNERFRTSAEVERVRLDQRPYQYLYAEGGGMLAFMDTETYEQLSLNEDLVEATALALDLGHAPFGYAGDEFLSKLLKKNGIGVFAHNAQSVRALENLEANGAGLNLTLQVLDGVLGHNCRMPNSKLRPGKNLSWENLDDHTSQCLQQEDASRDIYPSTLEGCVVRLADVISYVGRDVEDAIASELLSRDELPKEVQRSLGDNNIAIINNLVMDVINSSHEKDHVEFSQSIFKALQTLLEFNDERIYHAKPILEEKEKLEKAFVELFEAYLDDLNTGDESLDLFRLHVNCLPEEYVRTTPPGRIVCDFIAGMTDEFLINQYSKRFVPRSFGSKL